MITCCKDCANRRAGCHADCERYAAWKAEQEAAKAVKDKIKKDNTDYALYAVALRHRIKTGRFRKR